LGGLIFLVIPRGIEKKVEALSVQNKADKHSLDEDKPMAKKKGEKQR